QRGNVGVVAGHRHPDVPWADLHVVGRVEAPPAAGPRLDPGVALTADRLTDPGVRLGVQVTGDVPGRDADRTQDGQREVGVVLTDALPGLPRVHGRGVHAGGARLVGELVVHPLRDGEHGLGRRPALAQRAGDAGQLAVPRHVGGP